ncbi:glutathione S-transferase N-terminal domain-containing protein [Algimonas porphyrae]|uniref:Glutathione S-transferase n=1 Tax=Algimonas porphyrae TaxID=1128113 RepID=A0ABQ5UXP0_9PROT|nr:glutathione S-transferase N-terminal domain-containing protein [Algimonas porphyrae]GLQ19617.1 glutathione S-transferase [Algimonas porphyrae]
MKLYTMAGTCALAPNIAVAWKDAPIEIVNLERGEHKGEAYLSINPRGQVPALVFDDGDVLTEATAILDYIGTTYGNDPAFGRDHPLGRKEAEALSYLSSEVHAAFKGHFSPGTYADTPQTEKIVRHKTYARLDGYFQRLNDWIAESDGPWLLSQRSFADAYLYIVMRWIERTPLKLKDYPNLAAHQRAMEQDDGVKLALERQGMKGAGG